MIGGGCVEGGEMVGWGVVDGGILAVRFGLDDCGPLWPQRG